MPAPRTPSTRAPTAGLPVLRRRRKRLEAMCARYPQTEAKDTGNEHRSLEVAGKRFGYFLYRHFGDDDRSGAVLKASPGVQETLVAQDPDRFWVPAFVGRHGWIGIRLDLEEPDWDELADFFDEAWRLAAPKRLLRDAANRESK
jgi:hypothetical protein